MRLVVLGSTGGTGKEIVGQALDRGHDVVALARRPDALGIVHPRLEVRKADVFDTDSLRAGIRGAEVVVSALGVVRVADMLRQVTLHSASGRTLIDAMRGEGVRRLVMITSGGVEPVDPSYRWFYRVILKPTLLARVYTDMQRLEALIQASDLDWTLVRPTALTNGPRTGQYRVSPRLSPPGGYQISRADLAHFVLDEAADGSWQRGTPTVAY